MKKLVLCSDGTGNSSAKAQKTNVWRIFQAVDQTAPDQLVKYDDGVGTSSNKYLAALGGAFGYGLKRNVIDLYKFVCRTYERGDEIYGFGFSRGAFTIRVVVALIESQGLVEGRSESELHAHALVAYRRYREARYPSWSPLVWIGRCLRDLLLRASTLEGRKHIDKLKLKPWRRDVPIRFLGLWDTVAAYGMPVDELKWGISLLIWPMAPVDHYLDKHVQRACHALSLDDQRQTFHPILFDEVHEAGLVADGTVKKGRLTQVWFAGAHSNVGGGYPEDQQSLVTLDWMISQALEAGLRLDVGAAAEVAQDKSAFARLYDSRHGLAAYYRYSPRKVDMDCAVNDHPVRTAFARFAKALAGLAARLARPSREGDPGGAVQKPPIRAIVHVMRHRIRTAFARFARSLDGLAARLARPSRKGGPAGDAQEQPIRAIVHGSVVMRMAARSDAYAPISLPSAFDVLAPDGTLIQMEGFAARPNDARTRPAAVHDRDRADREPHGGPEATIASFAAPPQELVEQVRDAVWWRRVTYFACLAFTLLLVSFPFAAPWYAALANGAISGVDIGLASDASAGSEWLDDVLRGIILPWSDALNALAQASSAGWLQTWLKALGEWPFKMLVALFLVGVPFGAGVFLAQRIHDRAWFAWHAERRQDYVDWLGESARSSAVKAKTLFAVALLLLLVERAWNWRPELAALLRLLAVALLLVLVWRQRIVRHLRLVSAEHVPITPTLWVARRLRTNPLVDLLGTLVARVVAPLVFALVLLWGIAGVASHFVARSIDSAGAFCRPSPTKPPPMGVGPVTAKGRFDTTSMCFATGIQVEKGVAYDVLLDARGSPTWVHRGTAASVAGVSKASWTHNLATPIKRSWSIDWLVPVLRQGRLGNVELPMATAADAPGGGVATLKFTASRNEELFVYLNDAVAVIPGDAGFFYDDNCGWASVTVVQASSTPLEAPGGGAAPSGEKGETCPAKH